MKILIVNAFYYPNMIGGTEQSIKLLSEGLVKRGHEVFILTGDSSKISEEKGVKITRLGFQSENESKLKKINRKIIQFNGYIISDIINKVLDSIKPDVVHTNNLFNLSTIIWKCAKKRNIKVTHTIRDYWGLCLKSTLLDSKGEICVKSKGLCKIHKHNYKLSTKYVDIVTSPSKFTLDMYKDNYMFEKSEKKVIPNAIDFDIDKREKLLRNRLDNNSNIITFLFIGSLDTHKGIKFLIESFKDTKLDNIRLSICGDGPLKKYVEENIKIDNRINYLGKVLNADKEKVLISSDVMVVPSIWYEPFGRVVIEGYKYGMPVIASQIGGISELLEENISLGVKPNCNEELTNAMKLLSNKEMVKKYISTNHEIISKYDIEKQIDMFEEIYSL